MNTTETPLVTAGPRIVGSGFPVSEAFAREIIETYTDAGEAAAVILALHGIAAPAPGIPSPAPGSAGITRNTTVELSGFAFWLALGAAAVAWILTHP